MGVGLILESTTRNQLQPLQGGVAPALAPTQG